MQRKPNEIWLIECIGKAEDHPRTSATFWSCITFDSVGTLTSVDGNIDSKKYTKILYRH